MWADYLTKQLPSNKFNQCIKKLGMIMSCTRLSGSVERNPTEPGLQPRTTKEKPTGDPPKATSQEVETESPTNAEDWTPSKETV